MIRDYITGVGNTTWFDVEVKHARTHIHKGKALFTDYEIEVKTNHPHYPLLHSKTRRRYSEFVWLRSMLGLQHTVLGNTPTLPRKQLIGRFKESFLQERQEGLKIFLNKLVEVHAFNLEGALQLFLQTNLKPREMEHYLKTRTQGAIKSLILMLHHKQLKKRERKITVSHCPSHDFPQTKNEQIRAGGRGWSSRYGDGYYSLPLAHDNDVEDGGSRARSSTMNAGVLPGGRLTLPTIPGSMEDVSFGSDTTEEEPDSYVEHPLSASWHGTATDPLDLILTDYDIIPVDVISQLEEQNRSEASDLGYLDLTTTVDGCLGVSSGEQLQFDY